MVLFRSVSHGAVCRICLDTEPRFSLFRPCKCGGTNKYVHAECLQRWRAYSQNKFSHYRCDQCKYNYNLIHTADFASLVIAPHKLKFITIVIFLCHIMLGPLVCRCVLRTQIFSSALLGIVFSGLICFLVLQQLDPVHAYDKVGQLRQLMSVLKGWHCAVSFGFIAGVYGWPGGVTSAWLAALLGGYAALCFRHFSVGLLPIVIGGLAGMPWCCYKLSEKLGCGMVCLVRDIRDADPALYREISRG